LNYIKPYYLEIHELALTIIEYLKAVWLCSRHSIAKQAFRTGDLSPGVWTSVWKPEHINRLWYRCLSCNQPNDLTNNIETCTNCGSPLNGRPTYW